MDKPWSIVIQSLALAAVDEGMSCQAAAVRFGVAVATVIRWYDQRRSTGTYAASRSAGPSGQAGVDCPRAPDNIAGLLGYFDRLSEL